MKLPMILISALILATPAFADVTCEDFSNPDVDVQVLRDGETPSREQWKTIDVLANFDYKQCKDHISTELLKVKGEFFWRFTSNDDPCDGGNTYGSIYTYNLQTPVVHIYDTDYYCEGDWGKEEQAKYHKCDLGAEALAVEKMAAFGFELTDTSSSLELREPYIYSYVNVHGRLANRDGKEVTLRVLTKIDDCTNSGVSITSLYL